MILAWNAVPAGPIGPRPKWPPTSLSRKSGTRSWLRDWGKLWKCTTTSTTKSSGILDRVVRDLDWLVAYKCKENSISMHVLGSDCIWNEVEPSKWYRIHKSHGRGPEPHKIHICHCVWDFILNILLTCAFNKKLLHAEISTIGSSNKEADIIDVWSNQ